MTFFDSLDAICHHFAIDHQIGVENVMKKNHEKNDQKDTNKNPKISAPAPVQVNRTSVPKKCAPKFPNTSLKLPFFCKKCELEYRPGLENRKLFFDNSKIDFLKKFGTVSIFYSFVKFCMHFRYLYLFCEFCALENSKI